MAEGTSAGSDDVVCRYFLSSSCRDGDGCLFSHDRARRVPDNACRYYLRGSCVFGENCRYDHAAAMKEVNSRIFSAASVDSPELASGSVTSYADTVIGESSMESLCIHHMTGACALEEQCPYIHGNMCELCFKACLHPFDEEQVAAHIESCKKELEENVELSSACQRSADKTCGICLEVVWDKEDLFERRFGILNRCNHCYCLSCIRQWRKCGRNESSRRDSLLSAVTLSCPQCRIVSSFVIPSVYYVDNDEDKKGLINRYREALREKPCRHFRQGKGICRFLGACFYKHARPDGTLVRLPFPSQRRYERYLVEFFRDQGDHASMNSYLESWEAPI